jgi:hypothetical protein
MELERRFRVSRNRDDVVAILCRDETLLGLFPGDTEVIESRGDHRRTRTHYRALGREGDAVFDFDFLMDGSVSFAKVCDGKVWRELKGSVRAEELDGGAEVVLELRGTTKSFVPEFTIKGPMEQQIEEMSSALREMIETRMDA